ncbi:MAG: hypothetical protein AB1768_15070 [Pseudomonadota bacterium]
MKNHPPLSRLADDRREPDVRASAGHPLDAKIALVVTALAFTGMFALLALSAAKQTDTLKAVPATTTPETPRSKTD